MYYYIDSLILVVDFFCGHYFQIEKRLRLFRFDKKGESLNDFPDQKRGTHEQTNKQTNNASQMACQI